MYLQTEITALIKTIKFDKITTFNISPYLSAFSKMKDVNR